MYFFCAKLDKWLDLKRHQLSWDEKQVIKSISYIYIVYQMIEQNDLYGCQMLPEKVYMF